MDIYFLISKNEKCLLIPAQFLSAEDQAWLLRRPDTQKISLKTALSCLECKEHKDGSSSVVKINYLYKAASNRLECHTYWADEQFKHLDPKLKLFSNNYEIVKSAEDLFRLRHYFHEAA